MKFIIKIMFVLSATQITVCTDMDSITNKLPIPDWMKEKLGKIVEK